METYMHRDHVAYTVKTEKEDGRLYSAFYFADKHRAYVQMDATALGCGGSVTLYNMSAVDIDRFVEVLLAAKAEITKAAVAAAPVETPTIEESAPELAGDL